MVSGNTTRNSNSTVRPGHNTRRDTSGDPSVATGALKLLYTAQPESSESLVQLDEGRRNSIMAYENQHSNHFHIHVFHGANGKPTRFFSAFINAVLATALFRCWHIIVLYLGWATLVTLINEKVTDLKIQPTLLTV